MQISIPQIIIGILSMFIAILGIRVIMPIINPVFNLTWNNSLALVGVKLMVYLVIGAIIYIVVYGTVMGKMPDIIHEKIKKSQNDGMNDLGWQ